MSVASLTPSRMPIIASLPGRTSYRARICAWSGNTPTSRTSGGERQRSSDRPAKAARMRGSRCVIRLSPVPHSLRRGHRIHFQNLGGLVVGPRNLHLLAGELLGGLLIAQSIHGLAVVK